MVDKYDLDVDDNYEPSDSEEEYTERERQLLKKARKGNKKEQSDDEEVLGFDEESEDDELIEPFQSDQSDGDEDDGLPDSRAWGKKKRAFYGGPDAQDTEYQSHNAEEEELAQLELQEATNIQKRLVKELNESDFALDVFTQPQTEDTTSAEVPTDLTDIPKRQRVQLFKKDSPEFEGLVTEMLKHLEESKDVLAPFLSAIGSNEMPIVNFVKVLNDLLLNYANNVTFYLLLKAQRMPIKSHPVIKRLFQMKQLIDKLQERYEQIVKPQIQNFMAYWEADNVEIVESDAPAVKTKKLSSKVSQNVEEEEEEMEVDGAGDEAEQEADNERRMITYQMAKNKGLTPKRKAEQRNPRVRNRNRYASAIKKRNKTIRPVQKELTRYGGEQTGIKAYVRRSTKLK